MKNLEQFEHIDFSLLIYGIDPLVVSKIMNDFQPSESRMADQTAKISIIGKPYRLRPNFWSKSSEVEVASNEVESHMSWYTSYLAEKRDGIREILSLPNPDIRANLTLFAGQQSSIYLPLDLLSVLTELGIGLTVSIYDYTDED